LRQEVGADRQGSLKLVHWVGRLLSQLESASVNRSRGLAFDLSVSGTPGRNRFSRPYSTLAWKRQSQGVEVSSHLVAR